MPYTKNVMEYIYDTTPHIDNHKFSLLGVTEFNHFLPLTCLMNSAERETR